MPPFDLAKTQALEALFAMPREARDAGWRTQFFAAVADASLMSFDPQVQHGPDGFPYFQLAIPPAGEFKPFALSQLSSYCVQYGFGAVIYPDAARAGAPGWVFGFGDMLALQLYGTAEPIERPADAQTMPDGWMASETLTEKREIMLGVPSESFLPAHAREIIGRYIRESYGKADPGVALVVDLSQKPEQNLLFNLTAADFGGDENRLRAALGRLRWFVPSSYGLISGITAPAYAPLGG